jgi:hypothetical protein
MILYAVNVQALNKLTITKSLDNKLTLLHYLAEHIGKASPEAVDFAKGLAHLEPASRVEASSLFSSACLWP